MLSPSDGVLIPPGAARSNIVQLCCLIVPPLALPEASTHKSLFSVLSGPAEVCSLFPVYHLSAFCLHTPSFLTRQMFSECHYLSGSYRASWNPPLHCKWPLLSTAHSHRTSDLFSEISPGLKLRLSSSSEGQSPSATSQGHLPRCPGGIVVLW